MRKARRATAAVHARCLQRTQRRVGPASSADAARLRRARQAEQHLPARSAAYAALSAAEYDVERAKARPARRSAAQRSCGVARRTLPVQRRR
jgi:hypothetical protein